MKQMKNRKNYNKNDDGKGGFLSMDDIAKIQEQIKKDQKKKKVYKKKEGKYFLKFLFYLLKNLMMMKLLGQLIMMLKMIMGKINILILIRKIM